MTLVSLCIDAPGQRQANQSGSFFDIANGHDWTVAATVDDGHLHYLWIKVSCTPQGDVLVNA